MPDASTMEPAAVLQRVDEIETELRLVESESVTINSTGLLWLCQALRTMILPPGDDPRLQDCTPQQLRAMASVCLDLHAALDVPWGDDLYARIAQLRTALADTRRVDYIQTLAPDRFWNWMRTAKDFRLYSGYFGFRLVRDVIDAAIGQDLLDADDAAMAATPRETN